MRIISRSKIQYNAACARIEELMEIVNDDTPDTDKNAIELDLLADLVDSYEELHFPISSPSLADVLKQRMFELKMTQADIAKQIGVSASRISEYLSGKSEPTLKVGRTISQKLDIDAEIVLGV